MAKTFPITLADEITGSVRITVAVGREMRAHLARASQFDPQLIENLIADKENEIAQLLADHLGCLYLLDE